MDEFRKPRALVTGSHIRLVSPASPVKEESLYDAKALLEQEGYEVSLAPHVFDREDYLAGSDQDRASDLMHAFLDPQVDGVLCTRGGYGCARLFPYLDLDAMAATDKWFGGFSDVTTIHLALNARGMVTFHVPMMVTLSVAREPWVIQSFLAALRGHLIEPEGMPLPETLHRGQVEGKVVGGCLCLLCDSLATPDALEAKGRILVIEDVDEKPHRVDAMLTHLINAGVLQSAAGLVIGEMTRTDDSEDPTIGRRSWRDIVRERLSHINVPTIIDYPFGHAKQMRSLALGATARLDADAGTLTYLEAACQ